MSISMDRRSIILVPSCFSRQGASNDIHDDPKRPIWQFGQGLGHGQRHHIVTDFITCWVTPPKWAVLPEYCQFSQNLLEIIT